MHELSIVTSVVEAVTAAVAKLPAARVVSVRLRVGVMASVVEDSLTFCYDLATEGTPLAGSKLEIESLPVVIHCSKCERDVETGGVQSLRCPVCGEPSFELKQGRELEIDSIEIDDQPAADASAKTTAEAASESPAEA